MAIFIRMLFQIEFEFSNTYKKTKQNFLSFNVTTPCASGVTSSCII